MAEKTVAQVKKTGGKLSDADKALKVQFVRPTDAFSATKEFLKTQAKKYGAEAVGLILRARLYIRSSSLKFNRILSGGILRGRVYEFFGPESGGKTTWALDIVANAQKQYPELNVLIIDAEATLDLGRAAILGVDVKKMPKPIVPPNGDVGLQMIYDACMSGAFSVIMLDSVAALNPSEEIVADVAESKNRVGLSGKMMSTALRKIVYAAYISDTAVIFINQLRDKPGVLFGPKEETPGGRALKFAASARIEITPVSGVDNIYLNAEKERIGQKVRMKAVKNKLGAPYREANIDLYYLKPLDAVSELIEIAEIMGIMTSEGRKKKFRGEIVGNNYDEMKILFMTKHDWRAALMEDVENGYAPQSDIEVEKEKELKELLAGDSTIVDQVPETMTEICEEDGEPDQAPSPQSVL